MIDDGWYKEETSTDEFLYYYECNIVIKKHWYNKTSKKFNGWRIIKGKQVFEDPSMLADGWKCNWSLAMLLPTFGGNAVLYQSPIGNTGNITYNTTSTYVGCQVGNGNIMVCNWTN